MSIVGFVLSTVGDVRRPAKRQLAPYADYKEIGSRRRGRKAAGSRIQGLSAGASSFSRRLRQAPKAGGRSRLLSMIGCRIISTM